MARSRCLFLAAVLVAALGYSHADPEFCDRGFQISGKFHHCWIDATAKNEFVQLRQPHKEYTPKLLEEYASHMCSVVKPVAMKCLSKEVAQCSDSAKLMAIADESGGACVKDHLNPFFKKHIIDKLSPIEATSPCFGLVNKAFGCYETAAQKIMQSGASHVDISRFYKVADKLFGFIWDCHVDLYKGMSDVCKNWQIPMLFSLQQIAMPSLFGMRLNNYQVSQLGLGTVNTTEPILPTLPAPTEECDGSDRVTSYLLVRVVKGKKESKPGDILIQLDAGGGYETELTVDGGPSMDNDVNEFVASIMNPQGGIDMRALRKKMREERKRQKEVNDYVKRIKSLEKKKKKAAAASKKPSKPPKHTDAEGMVN